MGYAGKATVLVVDDDDAVRQITADMLAAGGYHTIEADGASQAIDLLSSNDVDVLLTDIHMPGLSGLGLARQAKRMRPDLTVVLTTGFIQQSDWDDRRNGTVLRKPYNWRQLMAEMAKATAVPEDMSDDRRETITVPS